MRDGALDLLEEYCDTDLDRLAERRDTAVTGWTNSLYGWVGGQPFSFSG